MEDTISRAEHVEWCKKRAIEYIDAGKPVEAWSSMISDLRKNDETKDHLAIKLGTMQMFGGFLNTPDKMRKFILGFN